MTAQEQLVVCADCQRTIPVSQAHAAGNGPCREHYCSEHYRDYLDELADDGTVGPPSLDALIEVEAMRPDPIVAADFAYNGIAGDDWFEALPHAKIGSGDPLDGLVHGDDYRRKAGAGYEDPDCDR